MVKFEAAVEIDRSIDEVFAYLDDPTRSLLPSRSCSKPQGKARG